MASVGVSTPGQFQSQSGPVTSPRHKILLGLLLAVATVALYYPVHRHPFLNYDDGPYVTENDQVQAGLTWLTVKWAFTTFAVGEWHPLTWLSHALDCQWFGLDPGAHHDTSLLLHTLNVVLLFWVLQAATGYAGRSAMVAALFALHPINVESVAWIAERKNLLSMFFFLLALGAYRWYALRPRIGRYLVVGLLFVLGLALQAADHHLSVRSVAMGLLAPATNVLYQRTICETRTTALFPPEGFSGCCSKSSRCSPFLRPAA